MKKKTAIFSATVFFWFMIFSSAEASSILCDDPAADNYNDYSECGCKYSDLFAGQQNSLCPSETSIMVFQEWMDVDYCLLMENGNKSWTKAQYEELLVGLGNIYNLTDFDYYENDVCDRTPGEYFAERYQEPYENGDCKIDGVNKFTWPPAPWDGTFVSNIVAGDLYWHFIGFLVRTEEATSAFSCCKQMFQSDDWTVFTTPVCSSGEDSDEDGICDDVDNCPEIANPDQEDVDNNGTGDVCDANTVYGYIKDIEGAAIDDVDVVIVRVSCGNAIVVEASTNALGYYSYGGLESGYTYFFSASKPLYSFAPTRGSVTIPQTEIRSYDFTGTED